MNDIFNVSNFLFTILYADDICLVLGGKSLDTLITLKNQEFNLLYIWLQSNKLTLNIPKITILFSIEQGLNYKIRPLI